MRNQKAAWLRWVVGPLLGVVFYVALWLLFSGSPDCADPVGLSVRGCPSNVKAAAYLYAVAGGGAGLLATWGLAWLLNRGRAR